MLALRNGSHLADMIMVSKATKDAGAAGAKDTAEEGKPRGSAAEPAEPASEKGAPDPGPPRTPPPIGELFTLDSLTATDAQLQDVVGRQVEADVKSSGLDATYTILFLYDSLSIGRSDADRIYRAISSIDRERSILLIVSSPGGDVAAAYFIAKLCREYTEAEFHVVVPRQAKSAATLIACGADYIHMGSLSELGPIDPQFGEIPALSLKNSVEHMASLADAYPAAAEMFASYLARSLRVEALGYYERVAESAVQYAIRLLRKRKSGQDQGTEEIARRLVYEYKDHGFVIDSAEAAEIFAPDVVRSNTPEYTLGNTVYIDLDLVEWVLTRKFNRGFAFTGDCTNGCVVFPRRED